jgi:hypothetical protein
MIVRVLVLACTFIAIWIGQCWAGPLDYFDSYEQKVDVAPILDCKMPEQFSDLSTFDPVIDGTRPFHEDPPESLTKGSLLDLVQRSYADGKSYLIEIDIRLYTSSDRAQKDFHRWTYMGEKNRFDKTVDNSNCKVFVSGVYANRGDMVPTRTGTFRSSASFLCSNLIIYISESSPSQHGEYKNKFIKELGRQMGRALNRK